MRDGSVVAIKNMRASQLELHLEEKIVEEVWISFGEQLSLGGYSWKNYLFLLAKMVRIYGDP